MLMWSVRESPETVLHKIETYDGFYIVKKSCLSTACVRLYVGYKIPYPVSEYVCSCVYACHMCKRKAEVSRKP